MDKRISLVVLMASTLSLGSSVPACGQATEDQAARTQMINAGIAARIVGRIGRSGLRRFLASNTMLGELLDRASSYRSVKQVEDARVAALNGLISALDAMLSEPTLPPAERAALEAQRSEAMAERDAVPEYRTNHNTLSGDVGSLIHVASFGSRPLYFHGKASTHRRVDREDRLGVLSLGGAMGVLYAPTDDWVVGLAATLSGHDADVHTFDGTSDGLGVGLRVDVGYIIHPSWALGLRADHTWSDGRTDIMRGSPSGPIQVTYDQGQRHTYIQAELMGRIGSEEWGWLPASTSLQPVVGVYYLTSRYDEATDNLGSAVNGTFGPSEVLGLVRAGLSGSTVLGSGGKWVPFLQVAYDYEFVNDMDAVLTEPHTLSASVGLTWVLGRTQRLSVSYTRWEGLTHDRTTNDLSLVATLDF
jgi:hypothetical protein